MFIGVNSLLGSVTVPQMGAYATAKWAQRGLLRTLQQETRDEPGLHVCIVSPGSINTPIYYIYAIPIMLSMDWRLTLAALVPYPLVLIVVKRTSRQLMERTLKTQEGLAAMSSRVQENLSGIHVVQAYVREEAEIAAFAIFVLAWILPSPRDRMALPAAGDRERGVGVYPQE